MRNNFGLTPATTLAPRRLASTDAMCLTYNASTTVAPMASGMEQAGRLYVTVSEPKHFGPVRIFYYAVQSKCHYGTPYVFPHSKIVSSHEWILGSSNLESIPTTLQYNRDLVLDYFRSDPKVRFEYLDKASGQLHDSMAVYNALALAANRRIRDSYDAGISLLSIRGNLLVNLWREVLKLIRQHAKAEEPRMLEVLINAVARAQDIPPKQRIGIVARFLHKGNRELKTATIDALTVLADSPEIRRRVKGKLRIATSFLERDHVVRKYAENALQEIGQ